jgi:hypothetical protein
LLFSLISGEVRGFVVVLIVESVLALVVQLLVLETVVVELLFLGNYVILGFLSLMVRISELYLLLLLVPFLFEGVRWWLLLVRVVLVLGLEFLSS